MLADAQRDVAIVVLAFKSVTTIDDFSVNRPFTKRQTANSIEVEVTCSWRFDLERPMHIGHVPRQAEGMPVVSFHIEIQRSWSPTWGLHFKRACQFVEGALGELIAGRYRVQGSSLDERKGNDTS